MRANLPCVITPHHISALQLRHYCALRRTDRQTDRQRAASVPGRPTAGISRHS